MIATDSLTTLCSDCNTPMNGLPWEIRTCPTCRTFMPPYYGHPEAPEELKEKHQEMVRSFARVIVHGGRLDGQLEKMRSDRIERAKR